MACSCHKRPILCHFGGSMQATFYKHREQLQHFHRENYSKLVGVFHFHSPIELLWVRRGTAQVWIDGSRFTVRENELAVVLSYEAHQFSSGTDGEYSSLFIPVFLCTEFMEMVRHRKICQPIVRDPQVMEQIRYAADRLSTEGRNPVEQTGWIHVLLGTVLDQLDFQEREKPREEDLPARLLVYIGEHYREELSAESIAQKYGYSADHLAKSFRSCFHMGIGQYINTLRLKNAVMLMREKKRSITDCALESGFGSLRTFYRVFDEEFGCSPREYLRRE